MRRTERSPHRQDLAHLSVPAVASATSLGCHPCSHVGGGSRCRASLTMTGETPSRKKGGSQYRPRVGASTQPPVPWIMDTVTHRARRGHEEQVAAKRRPERYCSPPSRACVRPGYSFLVGG